MTRCQIALGGNLGDVAETFRKALDTLDSDPATSVVSVASNHGTRPVGENAGDAFLNTAATLDTDLGPAELLARLHEIEAEHGRERTVHWGPRTLDLDLLLHGDVVVDTPALRVPHPALWYRRFVLDPLVEIASEVVHPERKATIGELHRRLLPRPLRLAIVAGPGQRARVADRLAITFDPSTVEFGDARTATIAAFLEPGDDARSFGDLPLVSRMDLSTTESPAKALVDVVVAALG